MTKSSTESEDVVRSWGFNTVVTWTDSPSTYYPPHTHKGLTTHLILQGQMTCLLPHEKDAAKKVFGPGNRVDIDAGALHEVWIGNEGCTMVIGE